MTAQHLSHNLMFVAIDRIILLIILLDTSLMGIIFDQLLEPDGPLIQQHFSLFFFLISGWSMYDSNIVVMVYFIQVWHIINTVPLLDMGNNVTVGRPKTYCDRDYDCDHEKSAFGFNAVLPN